MTRDEQDWREWAQWAEQSRRDAALRGDLTIVRDNRADDELTDAERAILAQNEAELRAPTASDTAAELTALRDENARLREAQANALAIIDEQAPALTGWRARDVMAALRAALEVAK